MLDTSSVLPILQTVLATANVLIIGYGFYKFLSKPHDDLETRVSTLELEHKEMKQSLLQGNDRFRDQEDTNQVLLHSILALIEFEIQYCLTEHKDMSKDLEKAKEDLHRFLSKRK